ncbi:MAG: hypothetical protein B0D96_00800 [Candidatus Sedimenticola endophacoides]|uniref:Heat-shock protein Hsp20 n=1 Tax=Candidatus Sedimenticola endophacoides TaxID=2548426 RepID=A0A6N4DJ02_9GAMM|nr:MAG: hypothetical protein B0D94_11360 [Candidatus Sedimenticola endophacoides]OQX38101.1 MAG: hypothetical protein B0D96_00800 [Candidatus Sedimenticola endophacoides]OQX38837.1 MAG: hypothetical protein B0D89_11970 [Candidatus Sedimenticola endophacoides]OQX45538.1 MAG: hypothetical protein B0D85_05490 [Candidatus Sedimenticola endophacoides]PUD98008.1 MAG: heat-shock protein Hsp20 [Candidatus Sedimenticola endophacoides]
MGKSEKKSGTITPRAARDLTPLEEMDRLFHQLLSGGPMRPFEMRWPEWAQMHSMEQRMPRVDVIEREDQVLIKAEIPGIEKENIDLSITEDLLTIKGETRQRKEEKGQFYRAEIHHGSFTRTVRLPCAVQSEQAKASFNNGMLEITVPKTESTRRVNVRID